MSLKVLKSYIYFIFTLSDTFL